MTETSEFVHVGKGADPLKDEDAAVETTRHNWARVGSSRPSSLLYTYGPGAVMDLPQFTIMPTGLDDWDRIWRRMGRPPEIDAPRLRDAVRTLMRSPRLVLRPFPWRPKPTSLSSVGSDLGVPAIVFPQWMRCTGCDLLAPLSRFTYRNTAFYRPDLAVFEHDSCYGRPTQGRQNDQDHGAAKGQKKRRPRPAVPARYVLACTNGHIDEFPYIEWLHHGQPCTGSDVPALKMTDRGQGGSITLECTRCGTTRPMREAQGTTGKATLPRCRGRHPHIDAYSPSCGAEAKLMQIGAANLWFPVVYSIVVMPALEAERIDEIGERIRVALGDELAECAALPLSVFRMVLKGQVDVTRLSDGALGRARAAALAPPVSEAEQEERRDRWDPVDLLVPEWTYLQNNPLERHHADPDSGLTLSQRDRGPHLRPELTRVLAVERLRKVNALVGFTRIDEVERIDDVGARLVPLTRKKRPDWTVATEDRGEGIFLQLDEHRVEQWETRVSHSDLWSMHRAAHRRNFANRNSETAARINPDERLRPPRYWLLHTLAHVLIRELAMSCGYNAASLSERLYAWPADADRPAAAGLLLSTTASDSDGTLGGLVRMSEPARLESVVENALRRATRCSADPICAQRTPQPPEEFLHGAACHCCAMASETSCERSNRFLDRRFLVDLPGSDYGFFGLIG